MKALLKRRRFAHDPFCAEQKKVIMRVLERIDAYRKLRGGK